MTRRNSTLSSRVGSPRASAPAPRIALPDFPADLTVKPGKLQKGTNQDAIGHGKIQIHTDNYLCSCFLRACDARNGCLIHRLAPHGSEPVLIDLAGQASQGRTINQEQWRKEQGRVMGTRTQEQAMPALVASIASGNGCHRHPGFPRSQVCIACPFLGKAKGTLLNVIDLSVNPRSLCTCGRFLRDQTYTIHRCVPVVMAKKPQITAIYNNYNITIIP